MAAAAVDDVTTYCFASVKDDASGSLDKANGGLCPANVAIAPFQSPSVVGDSMPLSWSLAVTKSSVTFKPINPLTTNVVHSSLYLCPGTDRRLHCANRIDLLAGPIQGTKFASTGTASFSATAVKLPLDPGQFTLVATATVLSNYTKENVTQPAYIDLVTYRNLQLVVQPVSETNWTPIALGIGGGVVLLLLLVVWGCCWHRRRQKERTEQQIATYAGAYIVRSRVNSYEREPSRTTAANHRVPSQYSTGTTRRQHSSIHDIDLNASLHHPAYQPQPPHVAAAAIPPPTSYDLKLTHYSSESVSPLSEVPSTVPSPTPTSESLDKSTTPSYLNFAISPLVEDELDFGRSVSFSSLDPPPSFDEGNGYLNYALSPLVEHSYVRGFNVLGGGVGMEMVHEEEVDDAMGALPSHRHHDRFTSTKR
ncbi:hypothetical protein DYB28_002276 [Aphanomyces astaci]|uniref:Uncharacterized protein n=2 Tax=Aphanomyces astaci TaxID=112090 RepID=A0A396ZRS7_APHAT|nr:hypothetical protein DYB25_008231 [Aphanomyces astaci]RHY00079.1 hypothetical protein DYB36_006193 [Aphanomyces astaci]RHY46531.1 hypothetical protein DYB30_007190 [Aphanomyces astaci]RHY66999.1 hypothetical protein DYB38_002016 [Aphanomyces astaci]RHY77371.1 hypothetical protein DYB34_006812 [Aphanomyces astaci]